MPCESWASLTKRLSVSRKQQTRHTEYFPFPSSRHFPWCCGEMKLEYLFLSENNRGLKWIICGEMCCCALPKTKRFRGEKKLQQNKIGFKFSPIWWNLSFLSALAWMIMVSLKKNGVKQFHRFWLIVETYFGGKYKKKPLHYLRIISLLLKIPQFPQDKWFCFSLAAAAAACWR